MDTATSEVERVSKLRPEEARLIYEQYSEWARHQHILVWVSASFGIGISLGGLTLFEKLTAVEFCAVGAVCLVILFCSNLLAERNRAQCMNHWRVLNTLESRWGVRDSVSNPNGPLLGFLPGQAKGGTRVARLALTWACVGAWVVAALVKVLAS